MNGAPDKAACPVPSHVYRLVVEYPEGIDWQNPPDAWDEKWIAVDETDTFHWPRVRQYLSKKGAGTRAALLRSYGCTVTVEQSAPVIWPSEQVITDCSGAA